MVKTVRVQRRKAEAIGKILGIDKVWIWPWRICLLDKVREIWSVQENEYTLVMEYDVLTVDVLKTSLYDAETMKGKLES